MCEMLKRFLTLLIGDEGSNADGMDDVGLDAERSLSEKLRVRLCYECIYYSSKNINRGFCLKEKVIVCPYYTACEKFVPASNDVLVKRHLQMITRHWPVKVKIR